MGFQKNEMDSKDIRCGEKDKFLLTTRKRKKQSEEFKNNNNKKKSENNFSKPKCGTVLNQRWNLKKRIDLNILL